MSVATKLSTTSRAATALQHPVITRNRPSVEGMTPTQLADFRLESQAVVYEKGTEVPGGF